MNIKTFIAASIALASCLGPQLSSLHAQGALAPPGAPAPTMRTLDQVYGKLDPRIAVSSTNTPGDASDLFIISQPGSYYLTTNITTVSGKNGIEINANNVSLDLGGFALTGLAGNIGGIFISNACTNVLVRNGSISGFGYPGVYSVSAATCGLVLERLNTTANLIGILIGGTAVVRDCNIVNNNNTGLGCNGGIISGCTAISNNADGISVVACSVLNCAALYNGNDGFTLSYCAVSGCTSHSNENSGFYITGCNISGCQATSNQFSGIWAYGPGSRITGNTCIGNNTDNDPTGAGVYITGANNRIEDNQITTGSHAGMYLFVGTGNIVIRNSVSGNGANNYSVPSGAAFGPIVNQSNGTITNTSPLGNFSF